MFILRRITVKKVEINTDLGIEYVLVLKEKNKEEFSERTKLWLKEDLNDLYGLVCFEDSEAIMPLYSDSSYYIMTNDGKTFANISNKIEM